MADKIEKRDTVYLANLPELSGGKGWHGKGITPKCFDLENLKEILWAYSFANAGILNKDGKFIETGEKYAVCSDDGLPVGNAVSQKYNSPDNLVLFNLFKDSLAGSNYEIVSAGTVENRVQFFVDAKGKEAKAGGRTVAPYVGIHRCFGYISPIVCKGHSTIIQCANTTALFLREQSDEKASIRNSMNVMERLPEFKKLIELQHGAQGEFLKAMQSSAKVAVKREDAQSAYVGLVGTDAKGNPRLTEDKKNLFGLATRTANRANRLTQLFDGEDDDGNEGKTLCDWFNGATKFWTHESAGEIDETKKEEFQNESRQKQWFSSEFGNGRNAKADLYGELFKKGEVVKGAFEKLRDTGKKIIQATTDTEILALLN